MSELLIAAAKALYVGFEETTPEHAETVFALAAEQPDCQAVVDDMTAWAKPIVEMAIAAERALITAWLRTRDHVCADILADQIEAGKYLG